MKSPTELIAQAQRLLSQANRQLSELQLAGTSKLDPDVDLIIDSWKSLYLETHGRPCTLVGRRPREIAAALSKLTMPHDRLRELMKRYLSDKRHAHRGWPFALFPYCIDGYLAADDADKPVARNLTWLEST